MIRYEGCYLYSWPNNRATNINDRNYFYCFQNILHEDQCTFAWVWNNFRSTFSSPTEITCKTYFLFRMHQSFLRVSKTIVHVIYFLCTGIKKNVIGCQIKAVWRTTHQFDVLALQKILCLSWCVRACIVVMMNYVFFFWFF